MSEKNSTNGRSRGRWSRFFREPSHRSWWALGIGLSLWVIHYGLTATPPNPETTNPTLYALRFLCLGVGGLLSSVAEFLPKDRTTLAGRLRITGYALFWVFAILLLLDVVLDSLLLQN